MHTCVDNCKDMVQSARKTRNARNKMAIKWGLGNEKVRVSICKEGCVCILHFNIFMLA